MAGRWKKIVIFIVLAVLIGLFFALDLQRFLTLAELKARQEAFQGYYAAHRLMTLAAYFLLYLAVTALSLPGAAIMTLAGGALFGFLAGAGGRLLRQHHRRHPGLSGQPFSAARLGAGAFRRAA